jgi:hypothetical protein
LIGSTVLPRVVVEETSDDGLFTWQSILVKQLNRRRNCLTMDCLESVRIRLGSRNIGGHGHHSCLLLESGMATVRVGADIQMWRGIAYLWKVPNPSESSELTHCGEHVSDHRSRQRVRIRRIETQVAKFTRETTVLSSTVKLTVGPFFGVQSIATFAVGEHNMLGNALDLLRNLTWMIPGLGLAIVDPLPATPVLTKRRDVMRLIVIAAHLLEKIGIEPPRRIPFPGINNGIGEPEETTSFSTGHPRVILLNNSSHAVLEHESSREIFGLLTVRFYCEELLGLRSSGGFGQHRLSSSLV